jgi:hypothetical protein
MVVVPGYGMVILTERGDMLFSYIQVLNVDSGASIPGNYTYDASTASGGSSSIG